MSEVSIQKLSFTQRPIPIPADYRPMYKIALIVLILKICSRSEKASLLKLHLLSWSLKSEANMNKTREYIASNYKRDFSVWGIEPALNRALQLAVGENLCKIVDGKSYKLTTRGSQFFNMIISDIELFQKEKAFLEYIGKNKITDRRIAEISKNWAKYYV